MKAQSVEIAIEQAVTDIDRQGNEALLAMAKLNDTEVRDLSMRLGQALAREQALKDRVNELKNDKNQLIVDVAQLECDLRNERETAMLLTGTDGVSH